MPPLATAPRVVIAGAGPAGAAAASLLREAGAIVTLLEQHLPKHTDSARRGSVVVGREAWDVLRRVGGGSLLDDARNVVSETEQLMSLRSLDETLGAEAIRRGVDLRNGARVQGVTELADGRGVSIAVRDAQRGAYELQADWFIDASGGKTSLALDPRFTRRDARGALELLPTRREFIAAQAPADPTRGVGWTAPDETFVINDRAEGILTVYRPIEGYEQLVGEAVDSVGPDLLRSAGVDGASLLGRPRTFTARQALADHAAQGRILLVGDSVGTVLPAMQAGTMLALTDAERAAKAIIQAHAAPTREAADQVIQGYGELTLAMHRAFLR